MRAGIERGDQGQHADEVDGGVEAGELVEVLAPGGAVHGAFGGGHARGHRDDAVGDGRSRVERRSAASSSANVAKPGGRRP